MTVNDIYKCSNMMDNTKFVIHSDDGVSVISRVMDGKSSLNKKQIKI